MCVCVVFLLYLFLHRSDRQNFLNDVGFILRWFLRETMREKMSIPLRWRSVQCLHSSTVTETSQPAPHNSKPHQQWTGHTESWEMLVTICPHWSDQQVHSASYHLLWFWCYLGLPCQSGGVERWDTAGSKNSDGLSIIIDNLKVQILIILPPLDLSPWTPLLQIRRQAHIYREEVEVEIREGEIEELRVMEIG